MRIVRDPKTGPTKCRSCEAAIVWAVSDRGKRMPLDAQASIDSDGPQRFVLWFDDESPGVQRVSSRGAWEAERGQLYRGLTWGPHWATCPTEIQRREAAAALAELEGKPLRVVRQLSLFAGGKS